MTSPGRGGKKGLTICSQNVCGLKQDEHVEGLFSAVHDRRIFAACVQETWRDGCEDRVRSGALFLGIGLNYNSPQQSRRGSQGVGIVLSSAAVSCWEAGGQIVHRDLGARAMAVFLLCEDEHRKKVGLFLISAYAPIGCVQDTE